jgi:hypothetical protein
MDAIAAFGHGDNVKASPIQNQPTARHFVGEAILVHLMYILM